MEIKRSATFTLSSECRRLIALLAKKLGVTKTAIVEIAIRKMAKSQKIDE